MTQTGLLIGILFFLLLIGRAAIALDVEARALFDGAALLEINGQRQLLKTGETSPQGVQLVESNANAAVIRIEDRTLTINLSERISSTFEETSRKHVQIAMDQNRQYITSGVINGRPVKLLVDTGANVVAMNENTARSLGISLADATPVRASTASDDLPALMVNIKQMQVGAITRSNVQAIVMRGSNPREILLGMTFLQHVEISEKNGLMTLTSKY